MYTALEKTLLAAFLLAGLLILPPIVSAHEDENPRYYSDQGQPGFYRWPNQERGGFRNDYWSDSYYGRHDRGKHRGWCQGKYRGWYGKPRYYDNSYYQRGGRYCPPRYYGKSSSNQYPWWR